MKAKKSTGFRFVRAMAGALASAVILATMMIQPARAGDCTGYVVNVRPPNQYNHASGSGYLAVRNGPGTKFLQTGEVYLGDEVAVWDRKGNWYEIKCYGGGCMNPFWGPAEPQGWVSGDHLSVGGVCP